MKTTVDKAHAAYVAALEKIDHEYRRLIGVASKEFEAAKQTAATKLEAAQTAHDATVSAAGVELTRADNAALEVAVAGKAVAVKAFDDTIRTVVQAPAGAEVIEVDSQLALYLGDGRTPIAYATHIGHNLWTVEGSGETIMCGDATQARAALWQRCRPVQGSDKA